MYKKLNFNRNPCNCGSLGIHTKYLNQKGDCACENHLNHQDECNCIDRPNKRRIKKCDWRLHGNKICNRYFCLNLAGLTDNLNYKLISKRLRPIEIGTIGGESYHGKTKHVGIDYVEIQDKHASIVTILKSKIKFIKFK